MEDAAIFNLLHLALDVVIDGRCNVVVDEFDFFNDILLIFLDFLSMISHENGKTRLNILYLDDDLIIEELLHLVPQLLIQPLLQILVQLILRVLQIVSDLLH